MAKYYPEGGFGPVCDVPLTDEEAAAQGRPARIPTDDELFYDEWPPYPPGFFDPTKDIFDPPPPYVTGRKCKKRTLPDGTIEFYDCYNEYLHDWKVDEPWRDNLAKADATWGLNDDFYIPELGPNTCSPFDPDINILPIKFYLSNGTTVLKYKRERSSPVTFPVTSDQGWTTEPAGTLTAAFDSTGQNLVVSGSGSGNLILRLYWADNPGTAGVSVNTITINGVTWTRGDGAGGGAYSGEETLSFQVNGAATYPITYGGLNAANNPIIVQANNTQLCLKDGHGTDCNGIFSIHSLISASTGTNAGYWSDTANDYAVWVNPMVCTLPRLTQVITYQIEIPETDTYGFEFGADDSAKMYLNDSTTPLFDIVGGIFAGGANSTPHTTTTSLTAGTLKLVVEVTNSDAGFPGLGNGEPEGLAFDWFRNPGGYYIKICQGGACISGNAINWVTGQPHPSWGTFMGKYAVYPSNSDPLIGTHSANWNVDIPYAGNYVLEYSVDDNGTWSLDGTQVATSTNIQSTSATTTLSNVSKGPHVLGVTVTNVSHGNDNWTDNPAGNAWTLSYPSSSSNVTLEFLSNGALRANGNGQATAVLNFVWDENLSSETTTGAVTTRFDNGAGIICEGTGTATITATLTWSDNPRTWDQALGTWSIGGVGFEIGSQQTGTETKTLQGLLPGTYPTVLDGNEGGFSIDNGGKRICLRDRDGSDCNASLWILNDEGVTATFDASANLVITGSGAGSVTFRFDYNDDAGNAGRSINHIVVGASQALTHSKGVRSGSVSTSFAVAAGTTYSGLVTNSSGGYTIMGNGQRVCFKDLDGNDCNAELKITSIVQDTTTTNLATDNALGTYRVAGASFVQGAAETGSSNATISVVGGTTYPATILNNPYGFSVQNSNQKLCFKDSEGSDCNASLTIGTITQVGGIIASSLDLVGAGDGNLIWHTRMATGYEYYEK